MAVMGIDFSDSKDCFEAFYTIAEQTDIDDDKRNEAFSVADRIIINAECEAADTGMDVEGVEDFINLLFMRNISVGIATNNSEKCVRKKLNIRCINKKIPIVGRQTFHPEYMKLSTWSATTVLNRLGSTSEETVFIGDGLNDYICAIALSMSFIGMASNEKKKKRLIAIRDSFMIVECYADIICNLKK